MTTVYSWRLLRAGAFRLDGGSMFGLIPRAVWTRAVTPDDRGRIPVQHNCLLLERSGPGDGPKLVIIEVGTRTVEEVAHYPDIAMMVREDAEGWGYFTADGRPLT